MRYVLSLAAVVLMTASSAQAGGCFGRKVSSCCSAPCASSCSPCGASSCGSSCGESACEALVARLRAVRAVERGKLLKKQ